MNIGILIVKQRNFSRSGTVPPRNCTLRKKKWILENLGNSSVENTFFYYAKSIKFAIQAEGLLCLMSVDCIPRSQFKYSSNYIAESV